MTFALGSAPKKRTRKSLQLQKYRDLDSFLIKSFLICLTLNDVHHDRVDLCVAWSAGVVSRVARGHLRHQKAGGPKEIKKSSKTLRNPDMFRFFASSCSPSPPRSPHGTAVGLSSSRPELERECKNTQRMISITKGVQTFESNSKLRKYL